MDIGKAIYNILSENIAVESLVGGRISPNVMKQTSKFPFIIYDVSTDPEGQKDTVALLDNVSVMISAYSKTYSEASKLANYIRTALDRVNGLYSGVNIQAIDFEGTDDIFDDMSGSDGIYRKSLNFNIRGLNSFNNIYSTNFDGVDDYVNIDIVGGLDSFKSKGTISAWVRLETVAASAYVARFFGDTENQITLFFHNGSGELRMTYKTDNQTKSAVSAESIEADGKWHHVAGSWVATEDVKLYVDGELKDETNTFNAFQGDITAAAIGSSTANSNYWEGNLDEISIFDEALSEDNITTIYNEGFPNTVAGVPSLIG